MNFVSIWLASSFLGHISRDRTAFSDYEEKEKKGVGERNHLSLSLGDKIISSALHGSRETLSSEISLSGFLSQWIARIPKYPETGSGPTTTTVTITGEVCVKLFPFPITYRLSLRRRVASVLPVMAFWRASAIKMRLPMASSKNVVKCGNSPTVADMSLERWNWWRTPLRIVLLLRWTLFIA